MFRGETMEQKIDRIHYRKECLIHNNKSLLILAVFLFVEQLLYSIFLTSPGSLVAKIHMITSVVSLLYGLVLAVIFINFKKGLKDSLWLHLFQFSYLVVLISCSVYRTVYVPSIHFSIPVIYIALLYGSAFLFYYPPVLSGILYGITSAGLIYLSFSVNHGLAYATFNEDVIVNNLLAWLGSYVAYRRFVQQIDSSIMIEEQNKELLRLSSIDWLTQLINRRQIDKSLKEQQEIAEKTDVFYSIIIADIDFFKQVNDDFGHTIGDKILIEITTLFKTNIDKTHILGRWGGEEFMLICQNTSSELAYDIAEGLRASVETHAFSIKRQITCSFGVSTYANGLSMDDVVRQADEALYASKNNGRNLVTVS